MQNKRRKLADKVVRCLPDLNVGVVRHGNEKPVRRKLDSLDRLFEVEMVEDNAPAEADQEGPPVCDSLVCRRWSGTTHRTHLRPR
jgi:hypothetical protein